MTSVSGTSASVTDLTADALVLGLDSEGAVLAHPQVPTALADAAAAAARQLDAPSKLGRVTVLPGSVIPADAVGTGSGFARVVLVGIGDGGEGDLRFAAGAASRACGKKPSDVVVALPAATDREHAAIAEGAVLGAYVFTEYKSDAADAEDPGTSWHIAGASDAAIERAKILAGAIAGVRDLVNTPPVDLYPASFAEAAQGFGEQLGCEVRVWEPQQLVEEGFGGILAVGMGSSRLPRLVRIAWTPTGAKQTVALVGKGITFDTGGLSLKQPKPMETMKSGAGNVTPMVATSPDFAGLGMILAALAARTTSQKRR